MPAERFTPGVRPHFHNAQHVAPLRHLEQGVRHPEPRIANVTAYRNPDL
jgi:hypothetical protein